MDLFETYEDFVARLLKAKTEEEVIACRAALRPWCEGNPMRLIIWGYRQPRKQRAGTDYALRDPTDDQLRQAVAMLRQGRRAHEIETYFAETHNVRVTRNRLSQLCGARP
jgi:hypothetical protein